MKPIHFFKKIQHSNLHTKNLFRIKIFNMQCVYLKFINYKNNLFQNTIYHKSMIIQGFLKKKINNKNIIT